MYGRIHSRSSLLELVTGVNAIPPDVLKDTESQRQWKIKCAKALFALRTSISRESIDHIHDISSLKEVWETLKWLITKTKITRLKLLKNNLATLKRGMSILK